MASTKKGLPAYDNEDGEVVKICTGCYLIKPVAAFYRLESGVDGLTNRCKPCYNSAPNRVNKTASVRREAERQAAREAAERADAEAKAAAERAEAKLARRREADRARRAAKRALQAA